MNSFNKTEAAIFPIQAMHPRGYPFSQLNYIRTLSHLLSYLKDTEGKCGIVALFCLVVVFLVERK